MLASFDLVCCKDLLHVLHQGVASCVIPAMITDHLEQKHPGITLKELGQTLGGPVWLHYKAWCRAEGRASCGHRFTLQRFGREKWNVRPELGSAYKASVVRGMSLWLDAYLLDERGSSPGSDLRCFCAHSLACFQVCCDENPQFFDPKVAKRTSGHLRTFLLLYQKLAVADRARTDQRMNFKLVPKFHCLLHLGDYILETRRNPRLLRDMWQAFLYVCRSSFLLA